MEGELKTPNRNENMQMEQPQVTNIYFGDDSTPNKAEYGLVVNTSMHLAMRGLPKAKLIAHLEKSLNAFITKTKKEEVL